MRTLTNDKPLIYDVYCGAGGCTKGYQESGFYVVGIDNKPQPHYCGDEFYQMDALEFLRQLVAGLWPRPLFVHASPPCQKFSRSQSIKGNDHPDLLTPTRELLTRTDIPYVIENVPGAPMDGTVMLCGTMFGLKVLRHRIFETRPAIHWPPTPCNHNGKSSSHRLKDETGRRVIQSFDLVDFICVVGNDFKTDDGRAAMSIDWMTRDELKQAIPPAYTRWIGQQMIEMLAEQVTE